MKFNLPELGYKYNALEPYIDAQTMQIHHTKHHRAYVDNLNNAISGRKLSFKSAEELLKNISILPKDIKQTVINNTGGHVNHAFFWKIMQPKHKSGKPVGKLKEAIDSGFGSLDVFREKFNEKAMALFGSGWVFLVNDRKKGLVIKRQSFQNSPLMNSLYPLLGIDLWEHAYYLKYQNKKADYISAWWNVVNWNEAERNYLASH